jgi:hypothetical protein
MDADDMIFDNDNTTGIMSGGFSVNSIMLKMGLTPLVTLNKQSGGANVSDMFDGMVIPNWAFTHDMTKSIYNPEKETVAWDDVVGDDVAWDDVVGDDVVGDDIYDKLLDLVTHYDKKHPKKQTKKLKQKKGSKNTRKNIN